MPLPFVRPRHGAFRPLARSTSDLLFREVFPTDRIAVSLGVGFNFKTGQVHFRGLFEVVVPVNDRCGVVPT
ncbi:hypothetical protein QFZ79_000651 [Arthrobacter sp. V4I6]|nr:hypothetical protein [Arthrobacter sp. V1I7]MDQ0852540.1 hypothetical protein [Arthrobacter sp. V4I6]